jgi:hypothetical protein
MARNTNEFILQWIANARKAEGFEPVDDPALMLLIVRKVVSNTPRMPRWEAEEIYRSLRLAADQYSVDKPEMQIFGAYDTPLAKIKALLDQTWRR